MFKICVTSFFVFFQLSVSAQQLFTINQSEALFLKNNLFLLASQYNIDGAKALTIQAKVWDNPFLSSEFNAINPQNGKMFNVGATGQKAIAIQQLIYMGGKKKKQVELAKSNEVIAALEFQDLLRNLKFQLRSSFYNLLFNQIKIKALDNQINNLDSLVNVYGVQSSKGNVAIKDYLRLQSLSIDFKNERLSLINENTDEEANLKILLGDSITVVPQVEGDYLSKFTSSKTILLTDLEQQALLLRPDYLLSTQQINNNKIYLELQKALRVPDLTVGTSWDQRGGAFNNQVNLTLALPLPLWNKNQGNIKYAEAMAEQSKVGQKGEEIRITSEVAASFKKWNEAKLNYGQFSQTNMETYDLVYNSMLNNFKKGNINILEFTDFLESYSQMKLQYTSLKKNIVLAVEGLNTAVNKELF